MYGLPHAVVRRSGGEVRDVVVEGETAAEGLEEEEQEEVISKILSSKILLTLRTML